MKEKILIVEDQFVEADYLRLMLSKAGYQVCDIARSVTKAEEIIAADNPDIVLVDIFLKGNLTGIDLAKKLHRDNIPFVYLSANSNEEILTQAKTTQPYGFLVKPFREKDLLITLEIARFRHANSLETRIKKEEALQNQLNHALTDKGTWEQKMFSIARAIQPYVPFDYLTVGFDKETKGEAISFHRISFDEYQPIGFKELSVMTGLSIGELTQLRDTTALEDRAIFFNGEDFKTIARGPSLRKLIANTFNIQSHLSMPLHLSNGDVFHFGFYSRRPDTYLPDHLSLFSRLEPTWTKSVDTMLANINGNTQAIPDASLKNDDVTNVAHNFEGIVGKSHLMLSVFDQISVVAPSGSSVLILGESGTGKERVADAIHNLSPRKNKPFIKVNCAALPLTLIESELFGHEKGSFTGAHERRIGKFEQADKGTIFLDEIGELPLEFQVKLLRVLQEKEVERIGAKSITKVDVRIIAATNRNLEKEVAEGRFRLDLYYRLNAFPIELPSLRERREDIPALADHFVHYYSRKAGRKITGVSDKVLQQMMAYPWPGNIRELEHMIERSVLLAKGTTIESMPLPTKQLYEAPFDPMARMNSIHENEREYILSVLKKCNGKIWGPGAAAEVLRIPPSTLKSKMKKLGIKKEYIE